VAELTQNYPNWRQSLVSEEFKLWLAALNAKGKFSEPSCKGIPYCYGTPTQLHGLFDEFYLNPQAEAPQDERSREPNYYQPIIKPEKPVQSYYQLSAADMVDLTQLSKNLLKFNKLIDKPFLTDTEIGAALTPIVTALVGGSDSKDIAAILDKLITVTPAKYQLLSAPPTEEASKETEVADSSTHDASSATSAAETQSTGSKGTGSKDIGSADSSSVDISSVDISAVPAVTTPAPQTTQVLTQPQSYTVTRTRADVFLGSLDLIALDKPQLTALLTLSAVPIIDKYLFGVALKDLGATLFQPSTLDSLYKLAYKKGDPSKQATEPLLWQASAGCGCTENSVIDGENSRLYYGVYPYWQQELDTRIDYNHLTRMGYFSATLAGQNIILPSNWRGDKPFSQFVINAHNHRVKVDLVISSHHDQDGSHWAELSFDEALIEQMIAIIKTPIKGNVINRLKPVISFGTSPSRTLADGVTLNFDLKGIKNQAQINEFIDFIKKLKQGLNGGEASEAKAHPDDEYYLNIMLPAYELKKEASLFYTVENLAKIEAYVNIFIVNLSPLSTLDMDVITDESPVTSETKADNLVEISPSINKNVASLKAFRTLLGDDKYSQIAGKIFAKSLPLIRTNDTNDTNGTEALLQVLDYTKWSYQGAAFWTLPLSEKAKSQIDARYFTPLVSEFPLLAPVALFADKVCNLLCPLRWPLRLGFFIIVLVVLVYAIASIWVFSLRELFNRWYFLVFLLLLSIFIILVFSCDPYWQEQQQLFLFIFILGIFGYNFFRQLALKRRGSLP
jgi:hypothetical protein